MTNEGSATFLVRLLLVFSLSSFVSVVLADEESKPFAEHRVVLQISDGAPERQTLVLNVANNLLKHYGTDKVDIEIVAFGPGLRLLFKENAQLDRILSLDRNGVRFSACSNTMASMSKKLGHAVQLNDKAIPVNAGVVRIIDLLDDGYKLVKP